MEKYYVLERFALMKTAVISTLDSMMLKRKVVLISLLSLLINSE